MKIKQLKNNFVRATCEYCGRKTTLHCGNQNAYNILIANTKKHECACNNNTSVRHCQTCKFVRKTFGYYPYKCSISGGYPESRDKNMPCWQPRISLWQRIKAWLGGGE